MFFPIANYSRLHILVEQLFSTDFILTFKIRVKREGKRRGLEVAHRITVREVRGSNPALGILFQLKE